MTTVYAATYGEYSDYRVDRLFTERALADRYVEVDGGEVEEFEIHDALPEPRPMHTLREFVRLDRRSGRVYMNEVKLATRLTFPGVNGPPGDRPVVEIGRRGIGWPDLFAEVEVYGYEEATVRQEFSDAAAGLFAEAEAYLASQGTT